MNKLERYFFFLISIVLVSTINADQASGNALSLDGKDDYVFISKLNQSFSEGITFEIFIKWNISPQHGNSFAVYLHEEGSTESALRIQLSRNKSKFVFSKRGQQKHLASKTETVIDKWFLISCVIDNEKSCIYVNGNLEEECSSTALRYLENKPYFLGSHNGINRFFNGCIDEVRIWNKALSGREIKTNMNKELTGNEEGLVLYYNFNELTPDGKVKDLSPYGNHGTLKNGAKLVPSDAPIQPSKPTRPKQAFPPDLIVENLKFIEPSYNRALDGLEEGKIQFDLINNGRGNAYDIEVKITPLSQAKHLSFPSTTKIDEISKKYRKTVNIPISADIDIESMTRQFRIEINEGFGFDTDPAVISFETQAFIPPDLQIKQVAIDDNEDAEGEGFSYGNGNSIIESGESIEVTAYVQNFGDGDAENVKAEVVLQSDDPNITYVDAGKVFNLGDIESGDYRKVDFYFYTSRRYGEENIPISIKLTEVKGKFGKTVDLGLKSGKRTQNVLEAQIARVQIQSKKTQMRQIEGTIKLSDVDKNIPKTNMDSNNILAVIIGIEEYKYAPSVDFALNDARTFYQYAKDVFGIPERNIYYRINEGATAGEFNKIFSENGWIDRRLKKSKTDVIIYYSGHGAPDTQSKKGYLIPSDIDPNYATTGFSIDDMYLFLSKLQARSVTLFLDACFSGESRSQEMLIAGIRPISVKIKNPILTDENIAVFTASTGEQYSSSYPEKQHGLFTYFLLKALKGDATGDDKQLSLDELYRYVYENVTETAGYLDKEQTPTFIGRDRSRVLINY